MNSTLPDWRELANQQLSVPSTTDFAQHLIDELQQSELRGLGADLLGRLAASCWFAALCFPAELRQQFAPTNAYYIEWVFALDELFDTATDTTYMADLRVLLDHLIVTPLNAEFNWQHLTVLAHDPTQQIAGRPYCLLTFVRSYQELRHRIFTAGGSIEGVQQLDRFVLERIFRTMMQEARWRLDFEPFAPTFTEYLDVRWVSISGGGCVAAACAMLPEPTKLFVEIFPAMQQMLHATGLINDLATVDKSADEGTPNAVLLLEQELGSREQARQAVRQQIDQHAGRMYELCLPYIEGCDTNQPTHIIACFIIRCWVITELMYSGGDFLAPQSDKGEN